MAVLRNGGEWKDFRLPLRLLIWSVAFPKCVLSFLFCVNIWWVIANIISMTHWYTSLWCDNKVRELDNRGIIHYEFVPTGETVNRVYYLGVLKRLCEKVRRKRPELFANNSWILHHDNAPAHTALSVREFLATKQITVLEHPDYSPDLAPSDFFLFPKIKEILKGRHIDDIRSNATAALKTIPQNQFQNCFEGLTRRWHRCIAFQGEYFEGDHGGTQQWGM